MSHTCSYRKFKIELFFLPQSTTSITQPTDRKNMAQNIIRNLEKNNALPKVSILKAMQMLVSAWNAVPTTNEEAAIADDDDPFKDLHNEIDALRNLQPDLVPEDVNATSLTDVDAEVSTVQPPLTDSELLAKFFETGNISDGDDEIMDVSDDFEEEPVECPGKSDFGLLLVF